MLGTRFLTVPYSSLSVGLCKQICLSHCQRIRIIRHISKTVAAHRIFDVPGESEVIDLKSKYPNPKELVTDLLRPLENSNDILEQRTKFIPKLNGQYWKAKVKVNWPYALTFTGVHSCVTQAEENAYLIACELYKSVGLLYVDDDSIVHAASQAHVLQLLEQLAKKNVFRAADVTRDVYHLETRRVGSKQGDAAWTSRMTVPWPQKFTVAATGLTKQSSVYIACLMACTKLKLLHLMTAKNNLHENIHPKYPPLPPTRVRVKDFDPHYQIYVDASLIGFGAYLLTKTDNRVRWMSESWTDHFNTALPWGDRKHFDSSFYEFYALLTACYTWKHKFVDQRVLCWTDNLQAATLVNCRLTGLPLILHGQYGKLFQVMVNMCQTYNIRLKGSHVYRVDNVAADFLSKVQIEKFKKVFPEAEVKSKKTKKLHFLKPIVPNVTVPAKDKS
ncbi:uncharacterized protein LOC124133808 [Haliotis rufescens]|uniref:uncharacterized protein LOC124133808 n=1 Tax=Haliotis rufescens TaxID=6454 RepID=UPI00201FAA34|nr:uncharacterized protein LOC124133808 [Haliotis rufescens]